MRVDKTRQQGPSRQIHGLCRFTGVQHVSFWADQKTSPGGERAVIIKKFRTIKRIHERRACRTISTSIFLVSVEVLTAPRNAKRQPFMPSAVFTRT